MEKSEKNRKYIRRNNFPNNKLDIQSSSYKNNYQNTLISEILNSNKNLKLFAKGDKNNINNIKTIKSNIQNIFSTEESRLKAIKYIIKSRKEKRGSSPNTKPSRNFSLKEEISKFNSNENRKIIEQDHNKMQNYNKRHLFQLSSDNIIFSKNNEINNNKIRIKNKSLERQGRKYNKRIIKKEDRNNIINNYFYNDNKFLNNNININCFSTNIINNSNNKNKTDKAEEKLNITEEEKNYINISFAEEGTFIPFDKNKNSNIINNEEDNNKIILINSHEISFRSFKNENEFFTTNNSNNNSLDNIDVLNNNKPDDINILNGKKYILKFETQEELIKYIQNNKIEIDNRPVTVIFTDELDNLKEEINKYKNEINDLKKEKELYSNEIIRLQNENELLRQKINEVYHAYEEIYKLNYTLKEINNEYEQLKQNINLKKEYKTEQIINFNFISVLNENNIKDNNVIDNNSISNENKNEEINENKNEIKEEKIEENNDNKNNNSIISKAMSNV